MAAARENNGKNNGGEFAAATVDPETVIWREASVISASKVVESSSWHPGVKTQRKIDIPSPESAHSLTETPSHTP